MARSERRSATTGSLAALVAAALLFRADVARAGPHLVSCSVTPERLPPPKPERQILDEVLGGASPAPPVGEPRSAFRITLVFDSSLQLPETVSLGFAAGDQRAEQLGGGAGTLRGLVAREPPPDAAIELWGPVSAQLGTLGQCRAPLPRLGPPLIPGDPWVLVTSTGQRELATRGATWGFELGPRTDRLLVIRGRYELILYDLATDRLGAPIAPRFFAEGADAQSGMLAYPTFLEGGTLLAGQQVDGGLFLLDIRDPAEPREVFPVVRSCSGAGAHEESALYVVAAGPGRSRVVQLSREGPRLDLETLSEHSRPAPERPAWLEALPSGERGEVPCVRGPLRDHAREHLGDP